mgnify:CR=1 FL=1
MKTLVLKVDPVSPDLRKIRLAAGFIKKSGLVAFPTETVYGLGADALDAKAVLAVFKAKKRPLDNPPIVHVSTADDVRRLVDEFPLKANFLIRKFWPGPLTLIFKRSRIVPDVTVAGLDTIAVRMPRHNVALALIKQSNCPIAAPSANLSGKPSPTTPKHVLEDLNGRIDAILDAGPTVIGVESTVLDLTVDPPEILRPGGITFEALKATLGKVELNPAVTAQEPIALGRARSPGVLHKHYAPNADVVLIEGKSTAVIEKIKELTRQYMREDSRVGVLCASETQEQIKAGIVKTFGRRNDLESIARNLFRLLREFDSEGADVILVEGLSTEGLGLAIMNRLRKAAGYKIVKA